MEVSTNPAQQKPVQITPTGAALGAVVSGVDVGRGLDEATAERLRQAFTAHSLLLLRQQQLSKQQQVDFARVFGEPVPHPTNTRDRDPDVPELTIISNVVEDGQAIGALGNAELAFHADLVFLYEPGTVSILYCVEAPASGGDTYWSSGYAAYAGLDPDTQARIDSLQAVYIHRNPAYNPDPPARHPLVCVHPVSRRKSLFISPNAAQEIPGLDPAAGQALLARLLAHATQDQYVWRHSWQPGDLIVWDNRCTLHRRDGFDASQRRVMRRTQSVGPPSA